ncbi:hypothetical protein T07_2335 [Trichinella nelsoni]|uniref:Uncharacterized protein n=1 Tax=Trichinella nelsoni TaxID=6336 RepID=A0A0V0SHU8_9BILA|nr:hypothetical protein T07_2335 [Trichinella nelsoni]
MPIEMLDQSEKERKNAVENEVQMFCFGILFFLTNNDEVLKNFFSLNNKLLSLGVNVIFEEKFIFSMLYLNESLNFKFAWASLTRTILPNFAGCSRLLDFQFNIPMNG